MSQGVLDYHLTSRGLYAELNQAYFLALYAIHHSMDFVLHSRWSSYFRNGYEEFFESPWTSSEKKKDQTGHPKKHIEICSSNDPKFVTLPASLGLETLQLPVFFLPALERILAFPPENKGNASVRRLKWCAVIQSLYVLNASTRSIVERMAQRHLPRSYCGIHLRRGDKIRETQLVPFENYIAAYRKEGKGLPIFLQTDEFGAIEEFRRALRTIWEKDFKRTREEEDFKRTREEEENKEDSDAKKRFPQVISFLEIALSQKTKGESEENVFPSVNPLLFREGYIDTKFNQHGGPSETLLLLAEVEALARSDVFIGSGTSNLSNFVVSLHPTYANCVSVQNWENSSFAWEEPGVYSEREAAR